jgi:hypothetical protein
MKNEEQQKEWLEINKIRKKLILLRYGTDQGRMGRHYSIAIKELELAQEYLKEQIET